MRTSSTLRLLSDGWLCVALTQCDVHRETPCISISYLYLSLKRWAEKKRFWADVARNFDDIPTYSWCQRGFQLTIRNLTSAENLFTTFSHFLMKCCLFLFCGPFWGNGASRDHDPL